MRTKLNTCVPVVDTHHQHWLLLLPLRILPSRNVGIVRIKHVQAVGENRTAQNLSDHNPSDKTGRDEYRPEFAPLHPLVRFHLDFFR